MQSVTPFFQVSCSFVNKVNLFLSEIMRQLKTEARQIAFPAAGTVDPVRKKDYMIIVKSRGDHAGVKNWGTYENKNSVFGCYCASE